MNLAVRLENGIISDMKRVSADSLLILGRQIDGWVDRWMDRRTFINCDWVYTQWQCSSTVYIVKYEAVYT
jgi:hypothetical protein